MFKPTLRGWSERPRTLVLMLAIVLPAAALIVVSVRHLRNIPAHKGLPILVLTTESDTDKKNLAREAGATGWMVKPFDPERLVATVRKVIP